MTGNFRMERCGHIDMYYAPHNEYINTLASVVIIGITPGWTQMRTAYEAARAGLAKGMSDEEVCRIAKEAASYAGSMRQNLISMLDELRLNEKMGLPSCADLFERQRNLLHTTSVLRFPIFVRNKNYTGASPLLLANTFLRTKAIAYMKEELPLLDEKALVIPLGRAVEQVLHVMKEEGILNGQHCLWGFPHPSGANGHRFRQFEANRSLMLDRIHEQL